MFPGRNDPRKTMNEASINQAFKRIGYAGKVTGHGFRHTMSTILHEQGYNTAWIETQLAHVDKNLFVANITMLIIWKGEGK